MYLPVFYFLFIHLALMQPNSGHPRKRTKFNPPTEVAHVDLGGANDVEVELEAGEVHGPRIPQDLRRAFTDWLLVEPGSLAERHSEYLYPAVLGVDFAAKLRRVETSRDVWVNSLDELKNASSAPGAMHGEHSPIVRQHRHALTRHLDSFEALFPIRATIAECVPLIRSYVSECTYFDHHVLEVDWTRLPTIQIEIRLALGGTHIVDLY